MCIKPKHYWLQPIKTLEEAKEHTETITARNQFGWLLLLLGFKKKKKKGRMSAWF